MSSSIPHLAAVIGFFFLYETNAHQTFFGLIYHNNEHELSPAYVVGSRWALTTKERLKGFPKDELTLKIGEDTYNLQKVNLYTNVSQNEGIPPVADLGLVKVNGRLDKHGFALPNPEYPFERALVHTCMNGEEQSYAIAEYNSCAQVTGLSQGYFCLLNANPPPEPGIGMFIDGMITGLVGSKPTNTTPFPVTAIAPFTSWMIDTMSEYIPVV